MTKKRAASKAAVKSAAKRRETRKPVTDGGEHRTTVVVDMHQPKGLRRKSGMPATLWVKALHDFTDDQTRLDHKEGDVIELPFWRAKHLMSFGYAVLTQAPESSGHPQARLDSAHRKDD